MTSGAGHRVDSAAAQALPSFGNAEDWNQIAFDDHVHDVNTKGRKSSTHLIMDAWIKDPTPAG